jgi:DNA-binding GntR family transcriptional regulator
MKPVEKAPDNLARWDGAVAFRLFADQDTPTLTVPEQIASAIGDRIIAGDLAPGSRMIEQELAAEFAVSRGPVRDALRILEREGLATILARRGAVVTELTTDEVREIFEVRAALIETAARTMVESGNRDYLAILGTGMERLVALAQLDDDGGQYAETIYRLSILGARLCGNKRLARMITALSLQTLRYSKLALASRTRRQRSVRLWKEAHTALKRGDTATYMALARQRVEESGAEAIRCLKSAQDAHA